MANDAVVAFAWNTLQAVYPNLPVRESLFQEQEDAELAEKRGYYLPDEDERLREVYTTYLSSRSYLLEMVEQLKSRLQYQDLRIFAIAYCAAAALMRSAGFLIEIARDRPVVRRKLDEAEPRYGLPRKTFTKIYRSFTSPLTLWQFSQAKSYYDANAASIHETLQSQGMRLLLDYLAKEEPFTSFQKRAMWRSRVGYRCYSLLRRGHSGYVKAMFHLFRISGSAIAGKRNPFQMSKHAGKRVTSKTLKEISKILRPGDIIVTRHDNALSNHFFPGYWPHAALFLGTPAMRRDLSLPTKGSNKENVLEAKKDGVKLRQLAETLSVDAFVVLRPDEEKTDIAAMLAKALTHEGKLYDFLFDFRKAERLACTEVIYRSFHGVGDWRLELIKQSGRLTLPAEELIRQSLENRFARVEAIFGANGCPLLRGQEAKAVLERTLGRE